MNRFVPRRFVPMFLFLALATTAMASAQEHFSALLRGYQETPGNASTGRARIDLTISADETEISYTITYPSVPGSVTQAHLHFGQPAIAGGIFLWICSNLGNGPAGTQACPDPPATLTGTWTAADVTAGAKSQGILPGTFRQVLRGIRSGMVYANIHSVQYGPGEIRGQILPSQ
jgi:hypothetical protein